MQWYISAYVALYVYVVLDNSNCYKLSTVVRVYVYVYVYVCNVCLCSMHAPILLLNFIDFTRATTVDEEKRATCLSSVVNKL